MQGSVAAHDDVMSDVGDWSMIGVGSEKNGDMAGLLPLTNELFIQFTRIWDQLC